MHPFGVIIKSYYGGGAGLKSLSYTSDVLTYVDIYEMNKRV